MHGVVSENDKEKDASIFVNAILIDNCKIYNDNDNDNE